MSDGAGAEVRTLDERELFARLDAALEAIGPERAALATDGDGTLWTSDVGEALFEAMVAAPGDWISSVAAAALASELEAHLPAGEPPLRGISGGEPTAIARELHAMYLRGTYPEDRVCAMMTWCMAGARLDELQALATSLLEGQFALRSRLIGEAIAVLRWADLRAVPTFLVSASPRAVVERAAAIVADHAQIRLPRVLAMTPRVEEGVIRPSIDGTWTYGEGKLEALSVELAVDQRSLVGAMGDNVFDAAMLRAACVPIMVRPKPKLLAIARTIPSVVIARS